MLARKEASNEKQSSEKLKQERRTRLACLWVNVNGIIYASDWKIEVLSLRAPSLPYEGERKPGSYTSIQGLFPWTPGREVWTAKGGSRPKRMQTTVAGPMNILDPCHLQTITVRVVGQ